MTPKEQRTLRAIQKRLLAEADRIDKMLPGPIAADGKITATSKKPKRAGVKPPKAKKRTNRLSLGD